jgi:hypothetical protein
MRRVAERDRIQRFMIALGVKATRPARLYFTGGATAVLLGWRASTIDVESILTPMTTSFCGRCPSSRKILK